MFNESAEVDLSTHTLFSELQRRSELPAPIGRGLSFVRKPGSKQDYWYIQTRVGALQRQWYIGADDKALRTALAAHKAAWEDGKSIRRRRRQLVKMIEAGGLGMFSSTESRVLEVLGQAGVFRAGGVLVGSFAFRAYGQIFGRQWDKALMATRDIDIASSAKVGANLRDDGEPANLRQAILAAEPGFVEVPTLDRSSPATKFHHRHQEISVDVLTPLLGRDSEAPVLVQRLSTYATPVRFLDYLIEKPERVSIAAATGIEVNLPEPGRFAIHKLVVAGRRRAVEAEKIRKDLSQAAEVLGALLERQPKSIDMAITAARKYGTKFWREAEIGFSKLDRDLQVALNSPLAQ